MDVNRLDKDELSYELAIRGVGDVNTVVEMRKSLRGYLRLEKSGITTKYPPYPYRFEDDSKAIESSIAFFERELLEFSGDEKSPSFLKTSTRLVHFFKRAERSQALSEEEQILRSGYLAKIIGLKDG